MGDTEDDPIPVDHEQSRSERGEAVLTETEPLAEPDRKYPMYRKELAAEDADPMMALPNETETLGSCLRRLGDETSAIASFVDGRVDP